MSVAKAKKQFQTAMENVRDAMGADEFRKSVLAFGKSHENFLRDKCPPDHPMLKLIDEDRRQRVWSGVQK